MNTAQTSIEPRASACQSVHPLLATRPAFLTITWLAACCCYRRLGGCGVRLRVRWSRWLAAGACGIMPNDYCDHLNGTDACNTQRLSSGGSHYQNGATRRS
jgi:hypothetical protein